MQPTITFPRPRTPRLTGLRVAAYRVIGIVAGAALLLGALLDATGSAGAMATLDPRFAEQPDAVEQRIPPSVPAPAAQIRRSQIDHPSAQLGGIPTGTGMWTWEPEHTEGGNARAIVRKATAAGLSHIYVRTGSSWQGFHGGPFLDEILPLAHEAGLRVYGWDFPTFEDLEADLWRAERAIRHRAPDGHRIDGFVADIETGSEGTNLSGGRAGAYGRRLRARVGRDEVLVACVPNPTDHYRSFYPYEDIIRPYDAVAPMVYWLNRQPDTDVTAAIDYLERFDKPLLPIGQAYDGGPEGGRPGTPPRHEIARFIRASRDGGAGAISFWSWQHASPEIWAAITDIPLYRDR